MKRKKNNKGFSLVELIIVIAIMAILMGVMAPNMMKYVEKTKRTKDVKAAADMAHQIELMATLYNSFSYELYDFGAGVPNSVAWRKDILIDGYGMTEAEIIEEMSKPDAEGKYNLGGILFSELGQIPVSATDPNYGWHIQYDTYTGKVEYVYLMQLSADGSSLSGYIEIYPEYTTFLSGN